MAGGNIVTVPFEGGVLFEVSGRANFDTAMPLRDYGEKLSGRETVYFVLQECTALDSTFMGVMAMLALKARRGGGSVRLYGADGKITGLLSGLGVLKLFEETRTLPENLAAGRSMDTERRSDNAARAQTVLDAHKTLVDADAKNAGVFQTVIDLAEQDVNRLKKNGQSGQF